MRLGGQQRGVQVGGFAAVAWRAAELSAVGRFTLAEQKIVRLALDGLAGLEAERSGAGAPPAAGWFSSGLAGLDVVAGRVLGGTAFGGQAGTSSRIRNYLGFPDGVSGAELAQRAYEQAWVFGTHLVYGNPATSLAKDQDLLVAGLEDGSQARARAVVIATGVSYRRLGIPELEALAGAGVFYGAGTIEAQAVAGKPAFVVGGGNSAGQAALHLSKYAQQVTILIRSQSLAASMSDYLIRQIEAAPNVDVRYRCEVAGGGGNGHLEQLLLRNRDSGKTEGTPAAGLFILIGAQPFTSWLPEAIQARPVGIHPHRTRHRSGLAPAAGALPAGDHHPRRVRRRRRPARRDKTRGLRRRRRLNRHPPHPRLPGTRAPRPRRS